MINLNVVLNYSSLIICTFVSNKVKPYIKEKAHSWPSELGSDP